MSASPIHSYNCVFRWYMLLLIYHLQAGKFTWSPTSKHIESSKNLCTDFLFKKTGLRIDQPSIDGGTTSTGNIPRQCFSNKNEFIFYASSLVQAEFREIITIIQNYLSVILRI